MSKNLTLARANLDRARELRNELRVIDETATAARRDYTADEKKIVEGHRSAITECEQRANTILAQEDRAQAIDAGLDPYSGLLGGDSGGPTSLRRIGALDPIDFSEVQLRGLHEELMAGKPSQAPLESRAVTDYPTIPKYDTNPVTFLRERTRIAQLMPTQRVESGSVTHYTTSAAASAADTVEPGATKPESTPGWTAVPTPIRKIAHWTDVPKEALDDFSTFASVIRNEMVSGLYNAENLQLISGSGVSPDITGMLATSGISTYLATGPEDTAVSIRKAITQMQQDFIDPDVIVVNPADAELFDLTNYDADGLHAVPNLAGGSAPTAWGVRLVITTQIASGKAIVANLAESTVLYMREPAVVFVDPYSQSNKNLVRFICEERLGLGVTRPEGILEVTFDYTA